MVGGGALRHLELSSSISTSYQPLSFHCRMKASACFFQYFLSLICSVQAIYTLIYLSICASDLGAYGWLRLIRPHCYYYYHYYYYYYYYYYYFLSIYPYLGKALASVAITGQSPQNHFKHESELHGNPWKPGTFGILGTRLPAGLKSLPYCYWLPVLYYKKYSYIVATSQSSMHCHRFSVIKLYKRTLTS